MKLIFLVVREGPEWTDPIEAFERESDANLMARSRNAHKDERNTIERLSSYKTVPLQFTAKV